jgi:hypothetical protein
VKDRDIQLFNVIQMEFFVPPNDETYRRYSCGRLNLAMDQTGPGLTASLASSLLHQMALR